MKRDHIDFQDRSVALAYLITFRCYGTWLHGDDRGSVSRRGSNVYDDPKITPNATLLKMDEINLSAEPFRLGARERSVVNSAIREVCGVRGFRLHALHVRTNHVHIVVNNGGKVERMMNDFKVYSTRSLRAAGLIGDAAKPWSRHGSTRYLWTEEHIDAACDYVLYSQGDELPEFRSSW